MVNAVKTLEEVRDYYGKVLKKSSDLQTSACCSAANVSPEIREILVQLADEVVQKFYGCGSPIPEAVEGCTVLDLGCGAGRDSYVLSKLVGSGGRVIGVDMTDEQLATAQKHVDYHTKRFGYSSPNIEFRRGYIEDLREVGIEDSSVDVVVSNCVINLSPDKRRVFSEIFRVLKPGGELYFSDVFASRRIPEALREDKVLYGECLSGALYLEDFRRIINQLGCPDIRKAEQSAIALDNPVIAAKIGMVEFTSITHRVFKLASLEDRCEDFGQAATYRGTIPGHPHRFALDDHHLFETDRPLLVCGNTAAMLEETRFGAHFKIEGDRSKHFGLFDCGPVMQMPSSSRAGCC